VLGTSRVIETVGRRTLQLTFCLEEFLNSQKHLVQMGHCRCGVFQGSIDHDDWNAEYS
jgi:hypothetical protein